MVVYSPFPLMVGIGALSLTLSLVYMFKYSVASWVFLNLAVLGVLSGLWWNDISKESSYLGDLNYKIQEMLKLGMILFIFSEVMFFFAWFWGFFHVSLYPEFSWTPFSLTGIDYMSVPLLNTVVLLSSGVSVTLAHHSMQQGKSIKEGMVDTIILGVLFTLLQLFEYYTANFTISDSVLGTTFFVSTGFHGTHVLVGTIFLTASLLRSNLTTSLGHVGYEFAIWYWHFVDVVWLFLFSFMYWWSY